MTLSQEELERRQAVSTALLAATNSGLLALLFTLSNSGALDAEAYREMIKLVTSGSSDSGSLHDEYFKKILGSILDAAGAKPL